MLNIFQIIYLIDRIQKSVHTSANKSVKKTKWALKKLTQHPIIAKNKDSRLFLAVKIDKAHQFEIIRNFSRLTLYML